MKFIIKIVREKKVGKEFKTVEEYVLNCRENGALLFTKVRSIAMKFLLKGLAEEVVQKNFFSTEEVEIIGVDELD